jgi:hypothetical protein
MKTGLLEKIRQNNFLLNYKIFSKPDPTEMNQTQDIVDFSRYFI